MSTCLVLFQSVRVKPLHPHLHNGSESHLVAFDNFLMDSKPMPIWTKINSITHSFLFHCTIPFMAVRQQTRKRTKNIVLSCDCPFKEHSLKIQSNISKKEEKESPVEKTSFTGNIYCRELSLGGLCQESCKNFALWLAGYHLPHSCFLLCFYSLCKVTSLR